MKATVAVSSEDENRMWSSGVINLTTPSCSHKVLTFFMMRVWAHPPAAHENVNKKSEVRQKFLYKSGKQLVKSILLLLFSHACYVYRGGALRRLMHTGVCIGLDIPHFPSLMYGFIMQYILCILYID